MSSVNWQQIIKSCLFPYISRYFSLFLLSLHIYYVSQRRPSPAVLSHTPIHAGTPINNCKQTQLPCPPIFPAASNPCFPAAASRLSITPQRLVLLSHQVARTDTPKEHSIFIDWQHQVQFNHKIEAGDSYAWELRSFPKLWAWIQTVIQISSQGHKELNSAPIKWLNDFQGNKTRVRCPSVVSLKIYKKSSANRIKSLKHTGYFLYLIIYSLYCFEQN